MKKIIIQINFFLGIMIIFMASDLWAAPVQDKIKTQVSRPSELCQLAIKSVNNFKSQMIR